jgi:hypothetical protein
MKRPATVTAAHRAAAGMRMAQRRGGKNCCKKWVGPSRGCTWRKLGRRGCERAERERERERGSEEGLRVVLRMRLLLLAKPLLWHATHAEDPEGVVEEDHCCHSHKGCANELVSEGLQGREGAERGAMRRQRVRERKARKKYVGAYLHRGCTAAEGKSAP